MRNTILKVGKSLKTARTRKAALPQQGVAVSDASAKLREAIEKKAYELFEQRGCSHGCDLQDWVEAEKIVTARPSSREPAGKLNEVPVLKGS